jgi:hypothetical protein
VCLKVQVLDTVIQQPQDDEVETENPQPTINKRPISHPINHIVLKQHVYHVELSLHGPNFQNLNLPLTLLIGLMNYFLTRKISLLIYALTKHVEFSKQLLKARGGKIDEGNLIQ